MEFGFKRLNGSRGKALSLKLNVLLSSNLPTKNNVYTVHSGMVWEGFSKEGRMKCAYFVLYRHV